MCEGPGAASLLNGRQTGTPRTSTPPGQAGPISSLNGPGG